MLANGGRAVFGTRSSRTGRGFSLDVWIADECHILALEAHSALMPATSARARPPRGEIVLAFDITPDRHCALVVCGRRGTDDLLHLEVLRTAPGLGVATGRARTAARQVRRPWDRL